jgi:ATP-dependent exoDNAse (exonuclease V) beta subunit
MTIHAAKGLEFPVVFIPDLGRGKGGSFGSPYLLHDPEFGLVCKVRDEQGSWVKPVPGGYGWAKWVNDSMETAEDKRLLYVACTRAADLLILSGKLGRGSNWLPDILDAWQIDVDGDEEESITFENYHLKVMRPKELPELGSASIAERKASFDLGSVPDLAKPYRSEGLMPSLSVSALTNILEKEDIKSRIRPVVWNEKLDGMRDHVPGYILGNVVHHTLAHGFFDGKSENEIRELIEKYGQQEGLRDEALAKASSKIHHMLTHLRKHPITEEIMRAKRALHEVPFSWLSPIGEVHGVIDSALPEPSWRLAPC